MKREKKVIYQVFTRLFGNTNTNNKPWGTKEEKMVWVNFRILPTKLCKKLRIWELHTSGLQAFRITLWWVITGLLACLTTLPKW
ncbi:hypothetical protein CCAN12_760082 [Capnocytophaga canimorsus]|uniref:Uncharacterized protein n=1 Tax=Capnocytophaga canimorsus TaxID=28188 RepID=A0A0B7HPR3_9FLAO|nr:hypothetical protein CCAN12_760082 [Capnocytophaga canimorsus]